MIEYGISYEISGTTDLFPFFMAGYVLLELTKYFSKKLASDKRQKEMAKKMAGVEYMLAEQRLPDKDELIMSLYGECKALGCNGHIDEIHNDWLTRRKLKTIKTIDNENKSDT